MATIATKVPTDADFAKRRSELEHDLRAAQAHRAKAALRDLHEVDPSEVDRRAAAVSAVESKLANLDAAKSEALRQSAANVLRKKAAEQLEACRSLNLQKTALATTFDKLSRDIERLANSVAAYRASTEAISRIARSRGDVMSPEDRGEFGRTLSDMSREGRLISAKLHSAGFDLFGLGCKNAWLEMRDGNPDKTLLIKQRAIDELIDRLLPKEA